MSFYDAAHSPNRGIDKQGSNIYNKGTTPLLLLKECLMFAITTLFGLIKIAHNTQRREGRNSEGYKELYRLIVKGVNDILPMPDEPLDLIKWQAESPCAINYFPLTPYEVGVGQTSGKIDAIKAYRHRTGHSLLTSKEDVENVFSRLGMTFYRREY